MASDSGSQFRFCSWTVTPHDKVNPILNGGGGGGNPPQAVFSIAQKLLGVGSWNFVTFSINV